MLVFPAVSRAAGTFNFDFKILPAIVAGVLFHLDITAFANTTLDLKFQAFDEIDSTFFDLIDSSASPGASIAFAQKAGTGTDSLYIDPRVTVERIVAANVNKRFQTGVPRKMRAVYTSAGGTVSTASLQATVIY